MKEQLKFQLLKFALEKNHNSRNRKWKIRNTGHPITTSTQDEITKLDRFLWWQEDILHAEDVSQVDALNIDMEGYEYRALKPFFDDCSIELWPKEIYIY